MQTGKHLSIKLLPMKNKFLAILVAGLAFAGCGGSKHSGAGDSSVKDSSLNMQTSQDTMMKDTVRNKVTGKIDSTTSGSGTGKGQSGGKTNP